MSEFSNKVNMLNKKRADHLSRFSFYTSIHADKTSFDPFLEYFYAFQVAITNYLRLCEEPKSVLQKTIHRHIINDDYSAWDLSYLTIGYSLTALICVQLEFDNMARKAYGNHVHQDFRKIVSSFITNAQLPPFVENIYNYSMSMYEDKLSDRTKGVDENVLETYSEILEVLSQPLLAYLVNGNLDDFDLTYSHQVYNRNNKLLSSVTNFEMLAFSDEILLRAKHLLPVSAEGMQNINDFFKILRTVYVVGSVKNTANLLQPESNPSSFISEKESEIMNEKFEGALEGTIKFDTKGNAQCSIEFGVQPGHENGVSTWEAMFIVTAVEWLAVRNLSVLVGANRKRLASYLKTIKTTTGINKILKENGINFRNQFSSGGSGSNGFGHTDSDISFDIKFNVEADLSSPDPEMHPKYEVKNAPHGHDLDENEIVEHYAPMSVLIFARYIMDLYKSEAKKEKGSQASLASMIPKLISLTLNRAAEETTKGFAPDEIIPIDVEVGVRNNTLFNVLPTMLGKMLNKDISIIPKHNHATEVRSVSSSSDMETLSSISGLDEITQMQRDHPSAMPFWWDDKHTTGTNQTHYPIQTTTPPGFRVGKFLTGFLFLGPILGLIVGGIANAVSGGGVFWGWFFGTMLVAGIWAAMSDDF